ncbi:carbohydrate binding domain-containing protein [Brachybacterium massiliense]|uniref:carbohydrate binding domain-containing protein n=1 Tax=Brachybacterium massiliense TaxID=1755098 RepID=UPI000B3BBD90|nr:carbohydrate binding domain-containing protein [Brachybacterium massiliense]
MTTSILPLRLGTARLGQYVEPGAEAPKRITVHGECWELVTDPQIAVTEQQIRRWAAQDAQEKAEAAQEEAVRLAGIAATEADEALEAVLGEMVSDKSNVFIQSVAPVAEMRKQGVLWIDTRPVVVDGAQVPGNIPKTWDPAAAQWVAVTDAAAVRAAADAADAHAAADAAAAAAGEAMAEARYGARLADRAPTPADGVDMPDGAGWHQYGLTTNHEGVTDVRLVQTWRWDGAQWRRLDMDTTMLPAVDIGTGTFGDLSGDRLDITGEFSARVAELMDAAAKRLIVTEDALLQRATVIEDIVTPEIAAARGYFEEIILGSGANVIPNGNLAIFDRDTTTGEQLSTLRGWPGATGIMAMAPPGLPRSIGINGRANRGSARFAVMPGETYYFAVYVWADRAGKRFYVQLNSNGQTSPYVISNQVTQSQEWVRFEGQVTIPQDVTEVQLNIYGNHTNGTTTAGWQRFAGFEMRRAIDTSLIVPGAIKARQILLTGNPDDPDEAALAASLAEIIKLKVGHLIVEDQADIEGARLVGEAFADYLNVTGQLLVGGEGAVFTGPVAFKNLVATGDPDDPEAAAIIASLARMLRIVAGDPTGERVEIDRDGVVKYGLDPDGVQYEMVRIGPGEGDNLLAIGDTTMSPEGVQAPSAEVETLTVGGQGLEEWLDPYPKGVVGFTYEGSSSAWDGSGREIVRLQAEAELLPNRRYSITVDQHFVRTRTNAVVPYVEQMRWTMDGTDVKGEDDAGGPSTMLAYVRHFLSAAGSTTSEAVPALVGWIDTHEDNNGFGTAPRLGKFALSTRSAGGVDTRLIGTSTYPIRITIRDEGPTIQATGRSWFHLGTPAQGSSEAPAPKPEVKRYTKTYTSISFHTYDNNDNQTSDLDVVQGLYAGGPSRLRRRGGWKFQSFTSDLSGATVEKIEVYVYLNHSYYHAGADVNLATHNGNVGNSLTSRVTVRGWKRNTGRWITLPSSLHNGFRNGSLQGIGVISTNSTAQQYARFNGSGAKIRITFRK